MDLSDRDRKTLWAKAGNLCTYTFNGESCNTELVRVDDGKYIVLGEECHIVGEKPKAARFIDEYPQRETYYNAILMCGVHHKIIDDNPDTYTMDVLHAMKEKHEEIIQQAVQNNTLAPLIIKDSEFLTTVEKAQKAIGMEINRPAELSNVKSELHVRDVQEAIGFSTNQGLTAITTICSCNQAFSIAYVGTPPPFTTCPHCGRKHELHR